MTKTISTDLIVNTLSYHHEFSGSTFVVKLGGSIIHNESSINAICSDLKLLQLSGINVILVHGGGKAITEELSKQNITSQFVDGLRVTSKEAMQVIEMVLCGQINLMLVKKLNCAAVKAVGVSGADNSLLSCKSYSKKHCYVGIIEAVNANYVKSILQSNQSVEQIIPVIAPIGVDDKGNSFNINADYAACALANAIEANKLIYLTDQDGIYDNNGNVISEISVVGLEQLIDTKVVDAGMLTKSKSIIAALCGHLNKVHILNGNKQHALLREIFTAEGVGTLCKKVINNFNKDIDELE